MDNEWQTVITRNATHDILQEIYDEDGNRQAIIDLPKNIQPGETLTYSIDYIINAKDMPRPQIDISKAGTIFDIPSNLVMEYTGVTETFARNIEIESLAKVFDNKTTVLESVTSIIGWIIENITYCNFDTPLYPNETLEDLQGDCDDQAILLISLLRSLGIPSFLQVGVVFSESIDSEKTSWQGHLSIKQEGVGWHGWAMVYVPPWGWIPVDLTLTAASDPLELILQAPEYESSVVPSFNVSDQEYIGEGRRSQEELIASDLYITISETYIEDSNRSQLSTFTYIGVGLVAGTVVVIIIINISRRKAIENVL